MANDTVELFAGTLLQTRERGILSLDRRSEAALFARQEAKTKASFLPYYVRERRQREEPQ